MVGGSGYMILHSTTIVVALSLYLCLLSITMSALKINKMCKEGLCST